MALFTRHEGTLMSAEESIDTRYRYTIWFDYTRETINSIQEGTMLAVPNFASDERVRRWSILEITSVMPKHFALQAGNGGYPGFVVEAARSAAQDWESQVTQSTEETTKIEVAAIPTNLEIVEAYDGSIRISAESNIPMVGMKVRVLDSQTTNLVANNGIDRENEKDIAVVGTLTRDDSVEILLRVDELLRTHFAIFGFTGVGKSNLLSTMVSKIFEAASSTVKLVFFDLMGEYTALLADQLLSERVNGRVLSLTRQTLPEGVYQYINGLSDVDSVEAAKQLHRQTLLPKALLRWRKQVAYALKDLLEGGKFKVFNDAQSVTVFDVFFTDLVGWSKDRQAVKRGERDRLQKDLLRELRLGSYKETTFTPELARRVREHFEQRLEGSEFQVDFRAKIEKLGEVEAATSTNLAAGITVQDLVQDLNDKRGHSLWVIQAHEPSQLRIFAHRLGNELYEARRQKGTVEPSVSFIFDEADEFVRSGGKESYELSAEVAETIARRGRKFGIGLGIATQRIRYLDTNIMSQPHTYFISKLPRLSDRTAVAEAFGFGNEILNQTFKFVKGQWLLVSHEATGLEAIPIPIKTPDANQRIWQFLASRYGEG